MATMRVGFNGPAASLSKSSQPQQPTRRETREVPCVIQCACCSDKVRISRQNRTEPSMRSKRAREVDSNGNLISGQKSLRWNEAYQLDTWCILNGRSMCEFLEPDVRKKEQAYNEEQYSAARRRMLSITFDNEDDYIPLGDIIARYSTSKAITPDLPIEEPDNSLSMGDEHLDTTPSIENLVPIPSEFEGISDDTSDVPTCDNNCVNVKIYLVESLINRDTSIVHSSKIDPILEEFAGELAHIAPIPPGIVEADFDPNDDTSSDDDDFEDIEYVSFEEVNDIEQEEKEFDLEDILQI
ncbi:hypothetical protein Tco_1352943 [Tanacetum coccineum]